jgi:ribose transport system ATP-binding protein
VGEPGVPPREMTPLLEARNVEKRYGPVVALRDASLSVEPGEVHALLGANGAGKSTLVKALTGVIKADSGSITVGGKPTRIGSPARAARIGLAPVFQDPALLPDLTVAQNLRLTRAPADAVRRRLHEMELDLDFADRAGDIPLPMLRMLDLARALVREPQLLLLDEITAALPSDLTDRVFAVMRDWRERGRSVLFITHRLAEVIAICDRATVLRDGQDVGTLVPQEGGEERIVEYMLGAEAARAEAKAIELDEEAGQREVARAEAAEAVVEVRELRVGQLAEVSFTLHAGEILGIAALEGQGQDDLFAALSGQRSVDGGEIRVRGKPLRARHPYDAIRAGLVLVPADRLHALLPQRSIGENIAAPRYNRLARWGPINMRAERRRVASAVRSLQIDTRAQRQVRRLSGGNQQKVTIGRWLASGFGALLCFDPTRGIDVRTKRQVYGLLRSLADNGDAVLFFSSELAEFPLVCHRVITIFGGHVTGELAGPAADEASLLYAMHGLVSEAEPVA